MEDDREVIAEILRMAEREMRPGAARDRILELARSWRPDDFVR